MLTFDLQFGAGPHVYGLARVLRLVIWGCGFYDQFPDSSVHQRFAFIRWSDQLVVPGRGATVGNKCSLPLWLETNALCLFGAVDSYLSQVTSTFGLDN